MTATARFLALFLGLAAAGSAAAQSAQAGRELVDGVVWKSKPSASDMDTYYPTRARQRDQGGWALLRCRVAADGRLEACRAPVSFPKEERFDAMALALAAKFRMAPATADGQPVAGAMITLPITLMTPTGRNNPRIPTLDLGAVLVPDPEGATPCGYDGQPPAKCAVLGLNWKASPTIGLFGPIAATVGPENGLANLLCTARDGKLTDCRATGDHLTQAGRDAMLSLAPHFVLPARARNGSKVEGRQVIAIFDWRALNATYAPVYRDAPN